MGETIIQVNGIEICARIDGPDDGVPLLLVMGLGGQLVSWEPGFVDELTGRGYRVVRFDNRDTGRSTHFDWQPDVGGAIAAQAEGRPVETGYTLSDMAADAAALVTHLGLDPVHVVGVSMGGMIVQTMAIEQAHAVSSVVSIMSTTGDPDVGQPTPDAMAALLAPPPADLDGVVAAALLGEQTWGSPAHPVAAATEARAEREFLRVQNPDGVSRQIVAIVSAGSRTEALGSVTMPFTVVHGADDTLVTVSGGRRTAEAVPGARYVEIEGMGHNLPHPLWSRIADEIDKTAASA